jgi:hypothetical protein
MLPGTKEWDRIEQDKNDITVAIYKIIFFKYNLIGL